MAIIFENCKNIIISQLSQITGHQTNLKWWGHHEKCCFYGNDEQKIV